MAFTGIKLNFSDDGECVEIVRGKEILPHRIDLIEERLDKGQIDGLDEMFFNYSLENCRNASTKADVEKENLLIQRFFEILHNDGGTSPDAA